jgi:ABC-2 type transport system permease protein
MKERILEIIRKEFRQVMRNPKMRGMMIAPPIIQFIVFGFAVNLDVTHTRIAWMDLDRTPESRALEERFTGSGHFTIVERVDSQRAAQHVLDHGDATAVLRIPPGFARDLARHRAPAVEVVVDGTDSNTASIVGNQANFVLSRFAAERLQTGFGVRLPDLRARARVWFNPDLKSRNYFVPGILVNVIMLVTLMLTAMAIVREKEIGTMEQLMVTPIRPIELILGKTLPFALVGLFDVVLIFTLALVVFQVPFRGSFLFLLVCSVLYLMTTLGMGLFLSTISGTQQQAMMSSFFFFQPAFMLSGFAFPIRNMPEFAQWLTLINPARYYMDIVRGVFLKGAGPEALWTQMFALAVFGVAILTFAALRFHKRLD